MLLSFCSLEINKFKYTLLFVMRHVTSKLPFLFVCHEMYWLRNKLTHFPTWKMKEMLWVFPVKRKVKETLSSSVCQEKLKKYYLYVLWNVTCLYYEMSFKETVPFLNDYTFKVKVLLHSSTHEENAKSNYNYYFVTKS